MKENKIIKVIIILALLTAFPINKITAHTQSIVTKENQEYEKFIDYVNEITCTNIQIEKNTHIEEYENVKLSIKKQKEEEEKQRKKKMRQKNIEYSEIITPYQHSDFKTWEDYRFISDVYSKQYELQQYAYTGEYGIRKIDNYYLVAMGSAYAHYVGEKMELKLSTGKSLLVMIGDFKQDQHTDIYNSAGLDNNDIIEFIVDQNLTPSEVWDMGSYNVIFEGTVEEIRYIK